MIEYQIFINPLELRISGINAFQGLFLINPFRISTFPGAGVTQLLSECKASKISYHRLCTHKRSNLLNSAFCVPYLIFVIWKPQKFQEIIVRNGNIVKKR